MRTVAAHCVVTLALVIAGTTVASSAAQGQTIQGQLIDANSGDAIGHAFIVLRDSSGTEVLRVLTDASGAFLIQAPATGIYRIQTAIIGWKRWSSPAFPLVAGETFAYRMEVPLEAIRLDALVIEGERECEVDPDSGRAVSIVWDEARKALEAVNWTRDSGRLRYQAIEFNRDLHPETLRSLRGEANRQAGMSTGSPFMSAPADELSTFGYIRDVGEGYRPYGPDAAVLLSQSFANDHCFTLQPHPDEQRLIGLEFRPVRSREIPDIQGVMWLDRETAQLQLLEFQYDRLPWPVSLRHAGGQIDFEQLPNGLWFVSEWRLRLPRLSRFTRGTRIGLYRVVSYSETGGYVVQLRRGDGTPVLRTFISTPEAMQVDSALPTGDAFSSAPSGIAGAVTNVNSGETLEGAVVVLLDHSETIRGIAVSDSSGAFAIRPPRAGSYSLMINRRGFRSTTSALVDLPAGIVIGTRANLRPSEPVDPTRDSTSFRGFGDVIPTFRFTREDIERAGVQSVFDLSLTVAGVRMAGVLNRPVLLLNEQGCAPTAYIDGRPSATSQVLQVPISSWVELVELSISPDDTPPQYLAEDPNVARCGTILIWSASN